MPVYNIQLDANGNGLWQPLRHLRQLTIINQSGSNVNVLVNNQQPGFSLGTNVEVQFEEEEAGSAETIGFSGGAANGTVLVSWE
jgi:hypothetical protein